MTDATFESILDTPMDDVEKPKPLPKGNYEMKFISQKLEKTEPKAGSGKDPTPYVQFEVGINAVHSDVDEDELEAAGGIEGKKARMTFYLTQDAQYRLKDFATEVLGLNTAGQKLGEIIQEMLNTPFVGAIGHKPSADGKNVYTEIGNCAAID
jgi:hypothetical protein